MLDLIRDALRSVRNPHFYSLEQSYQGEFLAEIRRRIPDAGLPGDAVVQQEYQKRLADHGINIKPDVIIHIPTRAGGDRRTGNFAVCELDLRAGPKEAQTDFDNLDTAVEHLMYPLAVFLNVDSGRTQANSYGGPFRDRLHCFAVRTANGRLNIAHSFWQGGQLIEEAEEMPLS